MLRWWKNRRWEPMEAKLIDQKFVERTVMNSEHGSSAFQVWDFMVELPAEGGAKPKRLVIRERTYRLQLPKQGKPVPILVNADGTKAIFDLRDARINAHKRNKIRDARRKRRDEERFARKLGE